MINFDLGTHVVRPLRQVFLFVAAPENDFLWQYGTLASARLAAGDLGVGSLFRTVKLYLGRRMEGIFEVTGLEPYRLYSFRSQPGPVVSQTTYTFEIRGSRTEIGMSIQMDTGDFFEQTPAMVEKQLKKQYRENLALLKNFLETSQTEQPTQQPTRE